MRTLLTLLAGLLLALGAAALVEGQAPAEPSWSSDGLTLTLQVGRLYDVGLLPSDAICGAVAEPRYPRRAGIGQFAAITRGSATRPAERERNGLVITPGWYQPAGYVGNVATARLSGIPLAPMRMVVQGERRCGRRHHLDSLTIVVAGSLPSAFAPHSLHYGIPLIHHDHGHDPDPAVALLRTRLAALESMIDSYDATTCELVDGRYWDSSKTDLRGTTRGRDRFFSDRRHCCTATESDWTRAQAWAACTTPIPSKG